METDIEIKGRERKLYQDSLGGRECWSSGVTTNSNGCLLKIPMRRGLFISVQSLEGSENSCQQLLVARTIELVVGQAGL